MSTCIFNSLRLTQQTKQNNQVKLAFYYFFRIDNVLPIEDICFCRRVCESCLNDKGIQKNNQMEPVFLQYIYI